jgi:hypothetical protein
MLVVGNRGPVSLQLWGNQPPPGRTCVAAPAPTPSCPCESGWATGPISARLSPPVITATPATRVTVRMVECGLDDPAAPQTLGVPEDAQSASSSAGRSPRGRWRADAPRWISLRSSMNASHSGRPPRSSTSA